MKRRQFVKNATGLTAGATALGVSGLASAQGENQSGCKTIGCDYDVIVVGGGNAGAAAARDSMKNGYKTLLLEARNRLGGRTLTSTFDGVSVELGGTWIYNTQPFVWAEVERYDLDIVETPGAVADVIHMILEDGKRVTLTQEQAIEVVTGWEKFAAAARTIIPRPYDLVYNNEAAMAAEKISALQHLNTLELSSLQRTFVRGLIETTAHNGAETISYLDVLRFHILGGGCYSTFMDSIARFKLEQGTISLINKMIADGGPEVRVSTPVKSVRDLGDKVVVTTVRGEELSCGAVINCLPMNTIGKIDFEPPLPTGVISAGEERHPGSGIKLYIKVKGDIGKVSTIAPGRPLNFVMTYKQGKEYTVLAAFGGDPQALDVYDDEAVQAALDSHLPGVEVLSSMSYDWNNDPYSSGTWATYRPGWIGKYYEQFQKEYGRIYFGSGDHGEGWRGTIDSAIGAGIRAARKVNERLG